MKSYVLATLIGVLPLPLAAEDLVVFAAASLKQPLDAIAAEFGDVVVSYGGSGAQARQVALGAPADIVLLANAEWMDFLRDGAHLRAGTDLAFLANRLVLVGQKEVPLEEGPILAALAEGPLAMGFVDSVPAGQYGKAALTALGLWEAVEPRVAQVDSVLAALTLVARGEAPLGVVYASDAQAVPSLAVTTFPEGSHPPIRYFGAVTAQATHSEAQAFLDALSAAPAQAVFVQAGFLQLPAP